MSVILIQNQTINAPYGLEKIYECHRAPIRVTFQFDSQASARRSIAKIDYLMDKRFAAEQIAEEGPFIEKSTNVREDNTVAFSFTPLFPTPHPLSFPNASTLTSAIMSLMPQDSYREIEVKKLIFNGV